MLIPFILGGVVIHYAKKVWDNVTTRKAERIAAESLKVRVSPKLQEDVVSQVATEVLLEELSTRDLSL